MQRNVHLMKLWCTLLQFWISNPGEFSDFFQKMHILFENSLGFVLVLFFVTYFSSVQSLSCVRLFATSWIVTGQDSLSITNSWSLLKLMSSGDAIQPSCPLSSPCPPAPNPSQHQGLFQWVNSSHGVAKVLGFKFSISPSNEHPGLISFRMDWLDLLAVQGTLKSLLHTFQKHQFFGVRLSSQSNSHVHISPLEKP